MKWCQRWCRMQLTYRAINPAVPLGLYAMAMLIWIKFHFNQQHAFNEFRHISAENFKMQFMIVPNVYVIDFNHYWNVINGNMNWVATTKGPKQNPYSRKTITAWWYGSICVISHSIHKGELNTKKLWPHCQSYGASGIGCHLIDSSFVKIAVIQSHRVEWTEGGISNQFLWGCESIRAVREYAVSGILGRNSDL